jgi:prevent-host-death family protein
MNRELPMTTISAADLANQLPHVFQALASGEEFLITDAGKPVARIVPASTSPEAQGQFDKVWQLELDEWRKEAQLRSRRYPPGFVVDDSRETIYGERENIRL